MKKVSRKEHDGKNPLFEPFAVIEAGSADILSFDMPFWGDGGVVAAYDICVMFCGGAAHPLVHDGGDPVVAVDESHIFADRLRKAGLSCGHVAAVFFVQAADTGVLCGIGVAEGGRRVGGAVVHEQYFKIGERLREDAVETLGQICFHIVYGYDDT